VIDDRIQPLADGGVERDSGHVLNLRSASLLRLAWS
jgi:hypothetical protein